MIFTTFTEKRLAPYTPLPQAIMPLPTTQARMAFIDRLVKLQGRAYKENRV